jgi:hypothetical protein
MGTSLSTRTLVDFRDRITTSWNRTVEGLFDTSKLLVDAEDSLDTGEWEELKNTLPFRDSVRSMMMSIGKSKRFNKQSIREKLPPNYNILYEYSQLEDDQWDMAVADGIVDTDVSTEAVRKWKDGIKYGKKKTSNKPTTRSIGRNFYATIPLIDNLPTNAKERIDEILSELGQELQEYGVNIIYRDDKTPRQQSLEDQKSTLISKLDTELLKELDRKGFNKLSQKKLDEMESAYFQRRYFQQHNKYPYPQTAKESIQRKDHPYSISEMDFPEFMEEVRNKKVLMQWTPIRAWSVLGKAKCIKLALGHTLATTSNQRANFKRQLKSIVSAGSTNANHAQKYLQLLVG